MPLNLCTHCRRVNLAGDEIDSGQQADRAVDGSFAFPTTLPLLLYLRQCDRPAEPVMSGAEFSAPSV